MEEAREKKYLEIPLDPVQRWLQRRSLLIKLIPSDEYK